MLVIQSKNRTQRLPFYKFLVKTLHDLGKKLVFFKCCTLHLKLAFLHFGSPVCFLPVNDLELIRNRISHLALGDKWISQGSSFSLEAISILQIVSLEKLCMSIFSHIIR